MFLSWWMKKYAGKITKQFQIKKPGVGILLDYQSSPYIVWWGTKTSYVLASVGNWVGAWNGQNMFIK